MVDKYLNKLRGSPSSGGVSSVKHGMKGREVSVSGKLHGMEAEPRLIEAVQNGDITVVRKYLRFGLSPDITDDYNRPLICLACRVGFVNVVSEFLNRNVDINAASADGQTALHVAVGKKHVDVIKLLLVSGASLTAKTRTALTPIDVADYGSEIWEMLKRAEDGILPEVISYKIPELESKRVKKSPDSKGMKKKGKKKKKVTEVTPPPPP